MGSKTPNTVTSTQTNSPPANVLNNYQQVYQQAQGVAGTPYQPYPGQLVAGINPDQQSMINQLMQAPGLATPYLNQGRGALNQANNYFGDAAKGLQAVQPYLKTASDLATPQAFSKGAVDQYMSPYTQDVINSTMANVQNQNAIQQGNIVGNAITSGGYGGDRMGLSQSSLANQQNLASGQTIAGLENQNYAQALGQFNQGNATRAQAAGIFGGLANTQLGTAGQYGNLGQGENQRAGMAGYLGQAASATGIAGASAGLQGGTLEQQNYQEQLNAAYQQYQQALSYPFQTTGWLSNIATGIGSNSGGTGTSTTPGPSTASQVAGVGLTGLGVLGATGAFGSSGYLTGANGLFSDRRVKEDVKPIGKTFDGQTLYRFRYKGDPTMRTGLIAQEVEKRHPGAVGEAGGIKTVDYGKATDRAADRGHFAYGGGIPGQNQGQGQGLLTPINWNVTAPNPAFQSLGPAPNPHAGGPSVAMPQGGPPINMAGLSAAAMVPKFGGNNSGTGPNNSGLWNGMMSSGLGMATRPQYDDGGVVQRLNPIPSNPFSGQLPVPAVAGLAGEQGPLLYHAAAPLPYMEPLKTWSHSLRSASPSSGTPATGGRPQYASGGSPWGGTDYDTPLWSQGVVPLGGAPNNIVAPNTNWGPAGGLAGAKAAVANNNGVAMPTMPKMMPVGASGQPLGVVSTPPANIAASSGLGAGTGAGGASGASGGLGPNNNIWGGIMAAGLGTMAGTSPFAMVNIGQGGLAGMREYQSLNDQQRQQALAQSEIDYRKGTLGISGREVDLRAQQLANDLANHKKQLDIMQQTANQTGAVSAASAAKIAQETQQGRYSVRYINGIGNVVYDTTRPFDPDAYKAINIPALAGTGAPAAPQGDQAAAPNAGVAPPPGVQAGPQGGAPPGVPGAPPAGQAPAGFVPPPPAQRQPAPGSAGWTATTAVPAGYVPPNQFGLFMGEPGALKTEQEAALPELKEARENSVVASQAKYRLTEMNEAFAQLPATGPFAPGVGADQRVAFGKAMNGFLNTLNIAPMFDTKAIAAGELLQKDNYRLGIETTKGMGREPGYIVMASVKMNPGMENTLLGQKKIVSGLMQGAQYNQDWNQFQNDYFAKFHNVNGARDMFNKLNPPEAYARRALASVVDPQDTAALIQNGGRPNAIKAIDAKYGPGSAAAILGQ